MAVRDDNVKTVSDGMDSRKMSGGVTGTGLMTLGAHSVQDLAIR